MPLLFVLLTHNFAVTLIINYIIRFTNDTIVDSLISTSDESIWTNNLRLKKTMKMVNCPWEVNLKKYFIQVKTDVMIEGPQHRVHQLVILTPRLPV